MKKNLAFVLAIVMAMMTCFAGCSAEPPKSGEAKKAEKRLPRKMMQPMRLIQQLRKMKGKQTHRAAIRPSRRHYLQICRRSMTN